MSVSSEVTRIEADRNAIRSTLQAWGLAQATDNLDDLADALAAVVNRGAVAVELDEGETYTVPAGYHNGSGAVTNGVRAGRLEPIVYDYNSGYVSNGSWIYENPTNTYVDIYRVEAGCSYFITLGGTVGTRFRVMFTTQDVTQVTGTVVGTSIKNLNNPGLPPDSETAGRRGHRLQREALVRLNGLRHGLRRWPPDVHLQKRLHLRGLSRVNATLPIIGFYAGDRELF